MGGRTAITISVTNDAAAVFTDALDVSKCGQFAVQLTSWNGAESLIVQVQQSFDSITWADYGSAENVDQGGVLRFDITSGPLGLIRFELTTDESAGASPTVNTAIITIVGFPIQWSS